MNKFIWRTYLIATKFETNTRGYLDFTETRMCWSKELNESIMRIYFEVTDLETNLTAHRIRFHTKFIELHPHLAHISEQRLSDQRRVIVNNKLIPEVRIAQMKQEVESQIENNSSVYVQSNDSLRNNSLSNDMIDAQTNDATTFSQDTFTHSQITHSP
ncbi:hypothetical protein ACJJTC_018462 [Scirpophaga incertulas]